MIDAAAFKSLCEPVPAADFIDLLWRVGFSAEVYREAHNDLAGRNWDTQTILWHLFRHGLDERRAAPQRVEPQALVAMARLPMYGGAFKAKLLTYLSQHLFEHVDAPNSAGSDGGAIAERWDIVQALTREGGCPYFIAGDSHSSQYARIGAKYDAWTLPIHLLYTGGSAAGLANFASRSGYGRQLQLAVQTIRALPDANRLPFLLQFGQVDLEFVYHYRRVRDGKRTLDMDDYMAFCDAIVAQYIRFVAELFIAEERKNVFLVSVFPPALSDAAWHAGYLNADIAHREATASVEDLRSGIREIEIASLPQRTAIHGHYNDMLRAACQQHGFGYVDGMSPFLLADGIVDPRYVIPETAGADHHLDARQTYRPIRKLIWDCIKATERLAHSG